MKGMSSRSSTTKIDHQSQSLDLATVRTTNETFPRTRERIFGLQEAPIYHPTPEEFKDPIQYIQKIKPEAEQYGIIKIVPPKNYKPGFCLNTEVFRFKTRKQKMNSMEGATRAKLNYLDKLTKFHRLHGNSKIRMPPVLDKRPIDLYLLNKEVAERGGFQKVCDQKRWADIGRSLGYSRLQCTSMSNGLKKSYIQIIKPYEHWLAKHKGQITTPLQTDTKDGNSDDESGNICVDCRQGGNYDNLVACDDCNQPYHIFCVDPPLPSVPSHGEWYCVRCLTGAIGDYGFEDGPEYSLPGFHAFCDKFKKNWFSKDKSMKNPDIVAEEDCEDEFWRLVDNPHETCEVEYGADLHSNEHGSGFSRIERGIDGVIKSDGDPWNLNMIPVLPSSLFTHIKTDIRGMMVPWLYIGMCFSTFCWHNEDHFTYSINYMHWGETKTWYGVPGEDTTKFEETMKMAVPELFEQQPDLLFQLVTMLSPGRLLKEKVRVYAVDQRPGEFVVTFPKAYHSGFNHGFNFCEAVNFAPMDWLDFGLECVKRYKAHRRQPCFSHDELLVNIAKMEVSQENMKLVKEALLDMQQRELNDRQAFSKQHPRIKQLAIPNNDDYELFSNIQDQNQEQNHSQCPQCVACHCYTYLSYVTCPCTEKVACFEHFNELCPCNESKKMVHLRFTNDELYSLAEMAGNQTHHPPGWRQRSESILANDNLTTEESIKMILKELDTEGIPKYYTLELEKKLAFIKQWEAQVSALLNPAEEIQQRKGSMQLKNKKIAPTYDGTRHKAILDLQKQISTMSLRSPVLSQLETRIHETAKFKNQIQHLLDNHRNATFNDLETMLIRGQNELHTDIEEMELLALARNRHQWLEILEPRVMQQQPLDYEAVTSLVKQAQELKLPMSNPQYLSALSKAQLGEGWVKLAKRLLPAVSGKQAVTMDDLDEVLNIDHDVPILRSIYQELDSFRYKVNSWLLLFRRTMMQSEQQQLLHRPTAEDIHNLQDQMRKLPRHMIQDESATLDLELKRLTDWSAKVKKALRPRYHPKKSFTDILSDMRATIQHTLNQQNTPPPPQQQRQPTKKTKSSEKMYCVCRQDESGVMVQCSVCDEWYHVNCINITQRQAKSATSYECPMCDPSYDLSAFMKRPTFEEFCNVMKEAKSLKLVPRTYPALYEIQLILTSYYDRLDAFCKSMEYANASGDKMMTRKYLMELLASPISFDTEIKLLHKVIHRTPSSTNVIQQQQQKHKQQKPSPFNSGNQRQSTTTTTTTSIIQSPSLSHSPHTKIDTTLHNTNNDTQHPSLPSESESVSLPAQVLPPTITVMQPPLPPSLHTNSDQLHQHISPGKKRKSPPTASLPSKRRQRNPSSNGYHVLSFNN